MKNKLIFAAIISIILMPCIFAASYEIELSQYDDKILEKHYILLDAKEQLEITLPSKYESLEVLNEYILSNGNIIVDDQEIGFSFINPEAIDKGRNYYLTKKIAPGVNLNNLTISLILDEGFVVSKDVYPKADLIGSDGRRIIIEWQFKDLSEEDSVPIFVIIESVKSSSYILIILILIIIAIASYFAYPLLKEKLKIFMEKKAEKKIIKKKPKKDITEHLLENEKNVVEELRKKNGLWQKQIQIRTGLNKVKLSRVLKNLEKRGFIRKVNFGKTNKIYLKR